MPGLCNLISSIREVQRSEGVLQKFLLSLTGEKNHFSPVLLSLYP
jgi:hypothetical protein